jgi:putative endopeptidase
LLPAIRVITVAKLGNFVRSTMQPKRFLPVALAFLLTLSATGAEPSRPVPPRFSVANMDQSVDPRVDFSRFAFGAWLKNNPIPADKSRWGGFDELGQYNWAALKGILEVTASRPHEPGSVEQKVGDFFSSALNEAAITAAGISPIEADLAQIAAISTAEDFARVLARLHDQGVDGVFSLSVAPDEKRSDQHGLYLAQGGMSLPSKEYYFSEKFATQREAFVDHVAKLLVLAGTEAEAAATDAATVLAVETSLATKAKTPVELRDRLANYNRMPTAEVAAKVSAFPLARYLSERGITGPAADHVIVRQPAFFDGLQEQLASRPLSDWQPYLRYRTIVSAAPALAAPIEAERFRFYGTVLSGTPTMEPRWQRAARLIDAGIGEALGELYVAQYYPPQAKARMDELIKNVKTVMRERLQKLDWMTEPTRQKALAKFDRFEARIGHPDTFRDYSSVPISREQFFENVRNATVFEVKRTLAKLGQPVDRSEWRMTPPTVNAYFRATANQIVFPAGILQPPFFDVELDDAVNYGAIGAVIGHEITHGFDDQGRRYDAEGNLTDWWTPEDAENFIARASKLIEQYNNYVALPGLNVNGALSLGENIADLGGTSIAFEALQRSLQGKERKLIDGFTPEQRFFLSWAQQWRTNFRDDALRRQVSVGPHSPGMFRAIGPISNMQEFFDAFGIKEGDPMWRKPADRVKIW